MFLCVQISKAKIAKKKKKKKEKEKNTWLDYIVLVIVQFHPWFKVFV